MGAANPLSIGAIPTGANIAYGIGPSVAATTRAAGKITNGKARAAAEDFEAVFLNSMFSQMMTKMDGEGPFGGSQATGVWRSYLTNEYSKAFAKAGQASTSFVNAECVTRMVFQERRGARTAARGSRGRQHERREEERGAIHNAAGLSRDPRELRHSPSQLRGDLGGGLTAMRREIWRRHDREEGHLTCRDQRDE